MKPEKLNRFLALEQRQLDLCLEQYQGQQLLVLGEANTRRVAVSPIKNHSAVSQSLRTGVMDSVADWNALPFANESIDVVVLLHALEQTQNPAAVLAEIARVLHPQGVLLVVGLNAWRYNSRWFGRALYLNQWVGSHGFPTGLRCQLSHVGLTVKKCYRYGFLLSKGVSAQSPMERLGRRLFPGLSLGYVWMVQKSVFCLTPIKPVWASIPMVLKPSQAVGTTMLQPQNSR